MSSYESNIQIYHINISICYQIYINMFVYVLNIGFYNGLYSLCVKRLLARLSLGRPAGRTVGSTDGRTDGRIDGRTDLLKESLVAIKKLP